MRIISDNNCSVYNLIPISKTRAIEHCQTEKLVNKDEKEKRKMFLNYYYYYYKSNFT